MTDNWKPGDVAMVSMRLGPERLGVRVDAVNHHGWQLGGAFAADCLVTSARRLVVIDPEDRAQVARLADAFCSARWSHLSGSNECDPLTRSSMTEALREFAAPTPPRPEEPTDATARVTDHRDNIWRLLADGDWVCTSGPDIGEYLVWSKLAGDRGPLTVEVTQ